ELTEAMEEVVASRLSHGVGNRERRPGRDHRPAGRPGSQAAIERDLRPCRARPQYDERNPQRHEQERTRHEQLLFASAFRVPIICDTAWQPPWPASSKTTSYPWLLSSSELSPSTRWGHRSSSRSGP